MDTNANKRQRDSTSSTENSDILPSNTTETVNDSIINSSSSNINFNALRNTSTTSNLSRSMKKSSKQLYPWHNHFLKDFPWLQYDSVVGIAKCKHNTCDRYHYCFFKFDVDGGRQHFSHGYLYNTRQQTNIRRTIQLQMGSYQ